ncbi:MAG: PAS domain S-box protein [Thermodesulfobacteriota bacterium]
MPQAVNYRLTRHRRRWETPMTDEDIRAVLEENHALRAEIRVARQAAKITADLVVKQFEETEKILHRFQMANAMRKAVLDSASQISIVAADKSGIIIVFNTGAENILGYRARDVIGKVTPELFLSREELADHGLELSRQSGRAIGGIDVLLAYAAQGDDNQREWTHVRKDGGVFPVRMSIHALRDAEGAISGFLLIANDISEQKRSEKALTESERNHRLLLKNLPNVVFKGYANGDIDFIDDKIMALTGYGKEEFLSGQKKWMDIVVPEDHEYVKNTFLQALKTDKSFIREYRIRSKSGEIFWIEEGGQIICDETGKIDFVIGAFLNITTRKLAEKALFESEEKYRSLFNAGPNPIVVLDKHSFEILDANPCAAETFAQEKKDLIGRIFTDFGTFEYDDRRPARIHVDGWPANGMVIQRLHDPKTDRLHYIKIKVSPAIYKGREATILAGTDITEVIEKDAQLIQASKMSTLGEMSAGIAHELNQPLNAIKLGNEFLKTMIARNIPIPDQDLYHVVAEVNEQVERASDIINRLRAFGRKTDNSKQEVDINEPVRGVLKMIGEQLRLESIRVVLNLLENPPMILAQHNRLEQVLFNLITNARDAINKKRQTDPAPTVHTITIATFCQNDRVGVSVSDTGIGIPKPIHGKVFEPFFTTKEVGAGMGLGLSIIYGIIRDYGGDIELRSEEGKGSTFRYSFPRVEKE